MDFQNRLASLLTRSAPQQPALASPNLGSGMAQQAAQVMQSRPYQLHIRESQALGQRPLTPEEFMLQGK